MSFYLLHPRWNIIILLFPIAQDIPRELRLAPDGMSPAAPGGRGAKGFAVQTAGASPISVRIGTVQSY